MKKKKKKPVFEQRVVRGDPICTCGTHVATMIDKNKFKCVCCARIYNKDGRTLGGGEFGAIRGQSERFG